MTQQVTSPQEQSQHQAYPGQEPPISRKGIISLLVIIGMLLLLFVGLVIRNLPQAVAVHHDASSRTRVGQATVQAQDTPPSLQAPGNTSAAPLQLPVGHYLLYEQQNNIYLVSTSGGVPQLLTTPGYIYNRAVPPIITSTGQLLYSGDGLWVTDIFGGTPVQIATLLPMQVITSMVLSSDGTTVAWSTEPANGDGSISIYAGPISGASLVYQQSSEDCPCFRIFSFLNGSGQKGDTTLMLTDDRGDHHAVQYGLWTLDLTKVGESGPQPLLDEEPQQGPLALVPYGNTLLYSSYEGVVPAPTDGSAPTDIDALSYANSLYMTTINQQPLSLATPQVILPEQHSLPNSAEYHWVTTPLFSLDGHTLVYIVFSSDAQAPFDRHSAMYSVQIKGSGSQLSLGKPQLLATSTSRFVELGVWLNDHILTFYADNNLYAIDIHTGAVTTIVETKAYARIIAVVGHSLG